MPEHTLNPIPLPMQRRMLLVSALAAAAGAGIALSGSPGRAAGTAGAARGAPEHPPTGWLQPPLPAMATALTLHDGRPATLNSLLRGRVSFVNLMFTGCSDVCPPQGALFAALANRVDPNRHRLLSLSIDALGDDAAALDRWRQRFSAPGHWLAAVPRVADVDRIATALRGTPVTPGVHTTQVYVFNAEAQLVFRYGDSPHVDQLEAMARHLSPLT